MTRTLVLAIGAGLCLAVATWAPARTAWRSTASSIADNNGAVNKAEWLALVERRFLAADPDRDGTLDRAELRSERGKAVARFMR